MASGGKYEMVARNERDAMDKDGHDRLPQTVDDVETAFITGVKLCVCFVGLQVSYVTWGVIQERIMTAPYETGEMFPSSVFLVFANRLLAIFVAAGLLYYPGSPHVLPGRKPPFYQFSFCSLSNVLSSFAQYEALKYVTFPTQVLFKSSKIIPVMLMGKFLNPGTTYKNIEYMEAAGITAGVAMFMLATKSGKGQETTSFAGLLLLCMYVCCDSFTSQWQKKLFKKNALSQYEMMFGVNFFSLSLTGIQLLFSGEGIEALSFLFANPSCLAQVTTLSICSATGQLFIFYTIKKFGPVIFTIMMTTRQMISMVLSCIMFGHPMPASAAIGAVVTFGTVGARIYRQWSSRR